MDTWLPVFSDWTLALLPRLFLYPGGLWMLLMLLCLGSFPGGVSQGGAPRSLPSTPRLLPAGDPASQGALALAWVGLALVPLPGAVLLPFPADRFSLVGLLLTSLALDWHAGAANGEGRSPAARTSAGLAIVLAVMAPLAGGRSLLQGDAAWGLSGWLSLAAVAAGLLSILALGTRDPASGGLRWLGWFGLAAAPLWTSGALPVAGPAWVWVSLSYLAAILVLAGLGRTSYLRRRPWLPVTTCWALAALSVLAALLR
jgi:hypothetical protein